MLATTTLRAPPSAGGHHDHNHDGANNNTNAPPASPSPAGVLRVGREIENIGERVPLSKKRITWRFVFADSEQVHTVTLEHSRISAKKRLRLDGRRLFTSEQYCPGDWRYEFQAAKTHAARFCVAIKDVKATVVEERRLDSIYELFVDGRAWDQLEDRKLAAAVTSSVWSSEMYARRVVEEKRVLTRAADAGDNNSHAVTAHCVAWTFAFGLHGTIHKLELRDLDRGDDGGEFVVILDSRLLTRVNHDDIEEDVWEYAYTLFEQHTLSVVVTLESEGKKYECFIDGCAWKDLGETDFVLQTGWFPVYSRSRGTSYFRNEATGVSQWDRPIMSRDGVAIDVPRRQSTLSLPPPSDRFDADGLVRLSNGHDAHVPEPPSNQHDNNVHQYHSGGLPASNTTTNAAFAKKEDSANLLDFSEMSVHVSPTAQLSSSIDAFDPFAHIAAQPPAPSSVKQQQQQPARRSSQPPPVDLLS